MENLARQLLVDARARTPSLDGLDLAVGASETFRVPLTKLAGPSGFSSLLSRALALAKRRSKSLGKLQVGVDGRLVVAKGDRQELETAEAGREGAVILITELLTLLVVLIGEPLTLGLVHDEWPGVPNRSTIRNTEEKT
jgi:hypothetical protein